MELQSIFWRCHLIGIQFTVQLEIHTTSQSYIINLGVGCINTLRKTRNEQHFADDIFKRIFFNENVWILIKISQKFVPKGSIHNIPALVQIMAWRRPGDKPLSEPMMVSLLTHICITRPQWVNPCYAEFISRNMKTKLHLLSFLW